MKFVHIADMHFDSPFVTLAQNEKFAQVPVDVKDLKAFVEAFKDFKLELDE